MGTRFRLSARMALAYAVQGAWWPVLAVHLGRIGVSPRGRGWIFATLALAALVTPAIAGRIADRIMPAQRLMAWIYAIGTLFLVAAASGVATRFQGLFPLFLAYWMLTIPYLGLINTVAMRNLDNPSEEFGVTRMWGTVGWMVAGWAVSALMAAGGGSSTIFWAAAALSASMAMASLSLPNTPPLAMGKRGVPWHEAEEMIRRPGVLVVLIAGFGASLTTPFVYQAVPVYLHDAGLPQSRVGAAMTLGQILEILALIALPRVVDRIGRRATMSLGIASWVLYHGLFASRPGIPLALAAISLNGLAIAFFHVAAPMYLDAEAPPDRRAGVQGLWVLLTSGVGGLVGGLLAGEVMHRGGGDWRVVFGVPASIAAVILVGFAALFRSEIAEPASSPSPLPPRHPTLRPRSARIE